jgi:rhamnulokinase
VQAGIRKASAPAALGIDTWGVDCALLDRAGHLAANPIHYRDHRTDGIFDYVFPKVSREEIFAQTGIQFMSINTLYQLASLVRDKDPVLENAASFVMVPDLLYYWLTGVKVNEFTNATTTQCYNPRTGKWATEMLEKLGIPSRIFGEIVPPGKILGKYGEIPAVLAPHHDTASAVVGVPTSTPNFAYISSGTWSLLGMELPQPVINDAALAANVTNEGGYGGTFRLLKNIMGLWLIQEARRTWVSEGHDYSYETLVSMANEAPSLTAFVDPDDALFLPPGDMPGRIRQYCTQTGQQAPDSVGAVARCIFESLALKYRYVLRQLISLTGQRVDALHVVGGGSQNRLLCQMTADATGCTVIAGPTEATSLGNAVSQLIALGDLKSVVEGRALIRDSFPMATYEPHNTAAWDNVEGRFKALMTN